VKLTIITDSPIPDTGKTKILLDGKDITTCVKGLSFGMQVGKITLVNLELVASEIDIQVEDAVMDLNSIKQLANQHGLQLITNQAYVDMFKES
jgi:hypothetical protein